MANRIKMTDVCLIRAPKGENEEKVGPKMYKMVSS